MGEDSYLQLMGVLLIFGSILFLAYIAARFIGKRASASMKSKHMQVIEQLSLGLDKRLLLIRVGSEHFLFLLGKKEFKQVAKIKLDESQQQEQEQQDKVLKEPVFDFRQIFDKYIHTRDKEKQMKDIRHNTESKQKDSDALRRNIHRLEQLREKSYDKEV